MLRHVRCLVLATLVLAARAAVAEVPIQPRSCVPNSPPGRCGWCALETLARHHHVTALYGLTKAHPSQASPDDLENALTEAHVTFRLQERGERRTAILREAVLRGQGAVVGFRELFPGSGGHIVTLVDFGPESVRVIDPNDPAGSSRVMPLDRFLYWWDGFALVLESDPTERPRQQVAGTK